MIEWTRDRARIQLYWCGWWVDWRGMVFDSEGSEMSAFVPWSEHIDHVAASGDPRATETPICHECAEAAAVGAIVGDVWAGYHTILLCDSCAARWAAALDPARGRA